MLRQLQFLFLFSIQIFIVSSNNNQRDHDRALSVSQPQEDCCIDTCCRECDPHLPDVETPFYGTGHQMPDTITEQGEYWLNSIVTDTQ